MHPESPNDINSQGKKPTTISFDRSLHFGKPPWLKSKIPTGKTFFRIKEDLRNKKLHTVCEEAKCPNIGYCWNQNTATFMIMGDTCTRACRFCHVKTGNPNGFLDPNEPSNIADSIALMKLGYSVITMVDRDDLKDGGADHLAQVLSAARSRRPSVKLEVLVGDFRGNKEAIKRVIEARPDVYAHNIETVSRLTPRVRDSRATYLRSLETLRIAKELGGPKILTKSAIMLGLGETEQEVVEALKDLRSRKVDFITIGQYLRPTKKHLSIKEFVKPSQFERIGEIAKDLGFLSVASGPLVRSSYKAKEFYENATNSSAN